MKRVVPKIDNQNYYPADVAIIVEAFKDKGLQVSEADATLLWQRYSEDLYCAGWLILPAKEEIVDCLGGFYDVIED